MTKRKKRTNAYVHIIDKLVEKLRVVDLVSETNIISRLIVD